MLRTFSRWNGLAALAALTLASLACSAIGNAIANNPAVATAQSIATQAGDLGELAETAEALATEVDLGDVAATAEALATEANTGDMQATAEAAATETFAGLGDAPPDIPILPGEKANYFATKDVISYGVDLGFDEVLDFYKKEMTKNEWTLLEDVSVTMGDTAVLQYDKPQRIVIISITKDPASGQTYVQILIQPK